MGNEIIVFLQNQERGGPKTDIPYWLQPCIRKTQLFPGKLPPSSVKTRSKVFAVGAAHLVRSSRLGEMVPVLLASISSRQYAQQRLRNLSLQCMCFSWLGLQKTPHSGRWTQVGSISQKRFPLQVVFWTSMLVCKGVNPHLAKRPTT